MPLSIKVAARESKLSQAQAREVFGLLQNYVQAEFTYIFVPSQGDKDLDTPLNTLNKTDFFTREIDQIVLNETADIAIHSAKDLPKSLPDELEIICLTQGLDPRDSFVSFQYTLDTFPKYGIVGVCSERRIEALRRLKPDCITKSIRGPIDLRIELMRQGHYDALILAEAGLQRLLIDVPRQILDIPVADYQGQLAIIAKKTRYDLKQIFKPLESRVCG